MSAPAYRLSLGPVPTSGGPVHEVLHIEADGQILCARGEGLEDALSQLDAMPNVSDDWCAAPALAAHGGVEGSGEPAQRAAALRHVIGRIDPDLTLDCPQDDVLLSLFAALALMRARKESLPTETSVPVRFASIGVYEGNGYAILRTTDDGISCVAMGSEETLHCLHEADPAQWRELDVSLIGVSTSQSPPWALDPIEALTGQRFVPELFVQVRGVPAPFGPKSTLLSAVLTAAWPPDPSDPQPQTSDVTLPVGRGRIALTPLSL